MMNVDEKRHYLNRYPLLIARIDRLTKQSRINADRKSFYFDEMAKTKQLRDSIEDAIYGIGDEREREILAQKYLCGRSLEETAELLNYSKRQIERLHLQALEHLCPT